MKTPLLPLAFFLSLATGACAHGSGDAPPAASTAKRVDVPAAATPNAERAVGEQTIKGELIDLRCYLDHGARGPGHRACGTSCALRGLPIALLDKDDQITIIVGANEKSMNTALADRMGDTVQLTGKVVSRSGMRMIEVSSVKP